MRELWSLPAPMSADATEDGPRRRREQPQLERQLRIVYGPARGKSIDLGDSGSLVVGRSAGNGGVVLADPRASRLHFEVIAGQNKSRLQIRDLGSRNGTKLNGERITCAPIANGDVVRAGDSLLVFRHGVPKLHSDHFVQRVAGADLHVLILGESGVGKEVLARRLHESGARQGPFVAINCAAVPRELLMSELCGHVRGAFSGAQQAREGLFLTARGGTLMLDEIGDMTLDLQPALLRVLETKMVRPVGGDREYPIDLRVIAATNVRLPSLVEAGKFRGDLYARLAQLVIEVSPLRARREEILDLAAEFASETHPGFSFDADLAEALLLWDWPYNVRELKSLVKAMLVGRDDQGALCYHDLFELNPEIAGAVPSSRSPSEPVQRSADILADRARLTAALQSVDGNVAALARKLGTSRSHVYRWLRRWELPTGAGLET